MSKRVFIIHAWTAKPNQHWYSWLAQELIRKNFEVFQPEMPNTDNPVMADWLSYLCQKVGVADEQTFFVGHSIGCLAILRYIENYNQKIGGAVLVAPWLTLKPESFSDPEDKKIVLDWTATPLNWEKLKKLCQRFVAIFSEDDPDVPFIENEVLFGKKLGAKIIIEQHKGHFTTDDGVTELPVALAALLELAKTE